MFVKAIFGQNLQKYYELCLFQNMCELRPDIPPVRSPLMFKVESPSRSQLPHYEKKTR